MSPFIKNLLFLVDEYQRHVPIRDTTLSNRLFGESKKIAMLRSGRDMETSRYFATVTWFADKWPETAAWPQQVERPEKQAA